MKTIKTGGNLTNNDPNNPQKEQNIPCKRNRGVAQKLRNGATKLKIFLKKHFPRRIWPMPRQDRKGPKF